jgi:transposase
MGRQPCAKISQSLLQVDLKKGPGQIAALVGVAPYHHESGLLKWQRHIQGGRKSMRCILYMATLSAVRYNPSLSLFYLQLLERGKPKKVALVACMHKLLRILNAMLRKQTTFHPQTA